MLVSGCGVHCGRNACAAHPRECREQLAPACPSGAGLRPFCVARSRQELASLDEEKRRCTTGHFSYDLGCMCGPKPCFSEKQRCENRGGTWSDASGFAVCLVPGEPIRP
jgi:hypothetical protein